MLGLAKARLWVPPAKGSSGVLARRAEELEMEMERTERVIAANVFPARNIPLKPAPSLPPVLEKS